MSAVADAAGRRFIVRKVAVLGAGVMGAQIAAHLVNVKVPVVLFDLPAKEGSGDPFYATKLATARFYFAKLLPETAMLIRTARAGAAPLMALDAAAF